MISNESNKLIFWLFGFIIIIFILIVVIPLFSPLKSDWLLFLIFLIVLIIILLFLALLYKRYFFKNRMEHTTLLQKPEKNLYHAKLVLKEKNEFLIKEYERIFGREDFVGLISSDDLMFIGKEHFKIIKKPEGYYILDLKTKNGTFLNGDKISGQGEVKLENGDHILIANTIEIRYVEY